MNYDKQSDTSSSDIRLHKSITQAESVIYFIQEMDIEMLDLILDNNKKYQELPKDIFLKKLETTFDTFKSYKNDKLICHTGFCNNLNCANSCKSGYLFIGNTSKHSLNLIFDVENGIIQDLHDCFYFKTFNEDLKIEDFTQLSIVNLDGDSVNGLTSPF